MARIGFVFIDDHGGDIGLFEFRYQRGDCRTVVENDHMIFRVGGDSFGRLVSNRSSRNGIR